MKCHCVGGDGYLSKSLPSRERGLKYRDDGQRKWEGWVAPLAGAWIEIASQRGRMPACRVAPLAGAWIEIKERKTTDETKFVAPLAGAWIEIISALPSVLRLSVAPLAGAWIEILTDDQHHRQYSRSPRGSVD